MLKRVLLLIAATALVGCAQPVKQAFNKELGNKYKTITLARADFEEKYQAIIVNHPAGGFGLIGGLIVAADIQAKETKLTAALDPKKTKLNDRYFDLLSKKLSEAGYVVSIQIIPKDVKPDDFIKHLKSKVQTDAILLTSVNGAYYAAGPTSNYFPLIRTSVKMVDRATEDLLYSEIFDYGYNFSSPHTVHISAKSEYQMQNFDALLVDIDKTRQGLLDGVDLLAPQIALDLKKN